MNTSFVRTMRMPSPPFRGLHTSSPSRLDHAPDVPPPVPHTPPYMPPELPTELPPAPDHPPVLPEQPAIEEPPPEPGKIIVFPGSSSKAV